MEQLVLNHYTEKRQAQDVLTLFTFLALLDETFSMNNKYLK
jgi:hypothetical protein